MQGNGRRPKSEKTSSQQPKQPPIEAKDEGINPAESRQKEESDEEFRQNDRVLRIVRQNADEKFNSDILAAGIIILALVLCSVIAYAIWAFALSRPAHNPNPPPSMVLSL